jgi:YgiT-type zinc finger domain-containing protein
MICEICGKEGARIRKVTRSYGKGKNLLIIENVPVVSCPHCGESYVTAETLHEIERIKSPRKKLATERPVSIADFADRSRRLRATSCHSCVRSIGRNP